VERLVDQDTYCIDVLTQISAVDKALKGVAVNGPHLVALVGAGARFDKGVMIERPDEVQEFAA
jgi:hypothetical protein